MSFSKYSKASDLERTLQPCDIVEFNRGWYSHYAFYIGDGICIHVDKCDKGNPKEEGFKCAEKLVTIAGNDLCRIDNQGDIAYLLGVKERSKTDAISKASLGLPMDGNNKPILGRKISVTYNLAGRNCEVYATQWKYNCDGWSIQVANGILKSSVGSLQRYMEIWTSGFETLLEESGKLAADGIMQITFAQQAGLLPLNATEMTPGLTDLLQKRRKEFFDSHKPTGLGAVKEALNVGPIKAGDMVEGAAKVAVAIPGAIVGGTGVVVTKTASIAAEGVTKTVEVVGTGIAGGIKKVTGWFS